MDDDGTLALRKFAVTWLWSLVSALPSLVLHALELPALAGEGADAGAIILPGLWFLCWGLTSPVFVTILGSVPIVKALPPVERRLDHLPPACRLLVREAATIRASIEAMGLDEALQRAWELAGEVDRAGPEVHAVLDHTGASLHAVHGLVALRAGGSPLGGEALRERLVAALASFEGALEAPRAGLFR